MYLCRRFMFDYATVAQFFAVRHCIELGPPGGLVVLSPGFSCINPLR